MNEQLLKLNLKTLIQQAEDNACDEELEKLKSYKDMEDLLANASDWQKAYWCRWYAECVLKAPFPLGEEAISKDAGNSYMYARFVLEAPFPLGEEAISKSASCSCCYARNVLKSPFPAGEEAILKDERCKAAYNKFLKQLKEKQ